MLRAAANEMAVEFGVEIVGNTKRVNMFFGFGLILAALLVLNSRMIGQLKT